uniref:Ovule protein n=1 Tax=Romanomermis culicivorax TaxID=13658 RepID=A0A915K247_ROMCU
MTVFNKNTICILHKNNHVIQLMLDSPPNRGIFPRNFVRCPYMTSNLGRLECVLNISFKIKYFENS